ncbi:MAG: hypothetical protein FWC59_01555, partial [Actinomycetia bacterium]|nr:hypothetical protein [Actinomycetes bacterium]
MSTTVVAPHKSSLGMNANLAVLVIYIVMGVVSWIPYLGWVAWAVPIVFYVLEKYSGFVKFHAVQALAIGIIRAAFSILLTIFVWILTPKTYSDLLNYATGGWGAWTVLGGISIVLGLAITALMIFMVITAWNYKQVELPI